MGKWTVALANPNGLATTAIRCCALRGKLFGNNEIGFGVTF